MSALAMSPQRSRNSSLSRPILARLCGVAIFMVSSSSMLPECFVSSASKTGVRSGERSPVVTRLQVIPRQSTLTASRDKAQDDMVKALRFDLEHLYTDGFTFTPLASDLVFVDPLMKVEGKLQYEVQILATTSETLKAILEPGSLKFVVNSIKLVSGDFNPFDRMEHPPRSDAPEPVRPASYAVHVLWETYGDGRVNLGNIVEQKPFYMSGEDIFRVDHGGQVYRHESAWDQSPRQIAMYFNPLSHVSLLDSVAPVFAEAIAPPKRIMQVMRDSDVPRDADGNFLKVPRGPASAATAPSIA